MGESLGTSVWSKMAKLTLLTGECCCKLELSAPGQGWGLGHCRSAAAQGLQPWKCCSLFAVQGFTISFGEGNFSSFLLLLLGICSALSMESSLQGRIEMCCQTEI